jgi:hypothetical protein
MISGIERHLVTPKPEAPPTSSGATSHDRPQSHLHRPSARPLRSGRIALPLNRNIFFLSFLMKFRSCSDIPQGANPGSNPAADARSITYGTNLYSRFNEMPGNHGFRERVVEIHIRVGQSSAEPFRPQPEKFPELSRGQGHLSAALPRLDALLEEE